MRAVDAVVEDVFEDGSTIKKMHVIYRGNYVANICDGIPSDVEDLDCFQREASLESFNLRTFDVTYRSISEDDIDNYWIPLTAKLRLS